MTYDQDKATDRAGDDADVRPMVSQTCRDGTHDACTLIELDACACDCHSLQTCRCRACGTTFACEYESFMCDECLDKPFPRPIGVFER